MAWIESHQSLSRHRKTIRAAGRLSVDRHKLIGHLHELWWWALDNVDVDGCLGDMDPFEVSMAAEWDGDPEEFVTALVEAGFLDRDGDELCLHDWYDYAGKLIENREVERERSRRRRAEARQKRLGRALAEELPDGDRRSTSGRTEDDRQTTAGTVPNRTVPYLTIEEEEEDAPAREAASIDGSPPPHDPELLQLAFRVFGGVGPTQLDILDEMVAATGPEVAMEALQETERYATGNRTRYCEKVIQDWAGRGIKTLDDLAAHRASREAKPRGRSRADPGESTADRIARLRAGGAL